MCPFAFVAPLAAYIPLSAMAHASYDAQRGDLLEAMKAGGLKAFLEMRDGGFRPEPFGPKSER